MAPQIATAIASDSSSDLGPAAPVMARTHWATWALSALPLPVTAALTRRGGRLTTGNSYRPHAASTTPRARPIASADRAFLPTKASSQNTALSEPRCSAITSATNWDAIDGGQLVDDDIIAFNGTTRGGASVSGTYTLDDASSDTVQGLLSALESAFGSDVNASIDSTGHIVITDRQTGASQLALSLDYSQTQNGVDIFGSVLTTNTGGQEGRYALDIEATNDGSDRLVFGSDRPWVSIRTFLEIFNRLNIPEADKEKILGENACKLFGIE